MLVLSHILTVLVDLTGCVVEDDDIPPPLPPRHPNMVASTNEDLMSQSLNIRNFPRIVRQRSEHSLLTASLNIGPTKTDYDIKDKKDKSKGKRKNKKSDTFSGRGTPTGGSVLSSPVRSSTMYFNSPSHTGTTSLAPSASFSAADTKSTPKKTSRWSNIRNKMGKKLRSPSISADTEEPGRLLNKPQRSHSIPSIKKCGVYSRAGSITGEEMEVGGSIVSPRIRRGSTSQNNVNLVAKIFSVLTCWIEEHFEASIHTCYQSVCAK